MVREIRGVMRLFLYLFLTSVFLCSCVTAVIERPEIRGGVFDSVNKKPIEGVSVYIDDELVKSDKEGAFVIKGITKKRVLNFESGHDPMFYTFKLKHSEYNSVNIKKGTRGSFDQKIIVYDSIFLKRINKAILSNNK